MRIAVIGGGPGGLYFAYLWKLRHPDAQVELFEQNPSGATWGFGVVFSDQALEFLRADDPGTVDAIAPRMEQWRERRPGGGPDAGPIARRGPDSLRFGIVDTPTWRRENPMPWV